MIKQIKSSFEFTKSYIPSADIVKVNMYANSLEKLLPEIKDKIPVNNRITTKLATISNKAIDNLGWEYHNTVNLFFPLFFIVFPLC